MNSDKRRLRPRRAEFSGPHYQRCDGAATTATAEHPPASCRYTNVAALNRMDRGMSGVVLSPARLGEGRPRCEAAHVYGFHAQRNTAGGSDRD